MTDHVTPPTRTVCYAGGEDLVASREFYTEVLGLEVAMEEPVLGFVSPANRSAQILVPPAGSEQPQPHFGVDLGDPGAVDAAHSAARDRGLRVVYPITDEPWGVRRFFVEDPGGTVVNVLAHITAGAPASRLRVARVSPRLIVPDPDRASEYYTRALDAERILRGVEPDGTVTAIIHRLGDFTFTVSPAVTDWGWLSPDQLGGSPVLIEVDSTDPDAIAEAMVDDGGQIVIPIEDRPHGKREGRVRDPFGHLWIISGDPHR